MPEPSHPLRRSTDRPRPSLPPTSASGKIQKPEVVEITSAVSSVLEHDWLDLTKRKMLRKWLADVDQRELQRQYKDKRFGMPRVRTIEKALQWAAKKEIGSLQSIIAELRQRVDELEARRAA